MELEARSRWPSSLLNAAAKRSTDMKTCKRSGLQQALSLPESRPAHTCLAAGLQQPGKRASSPAERPVWQGIYQAVPTVTAIDAEMQGKEAQAYPSSPVVGVRARSISRDSWSGVVGDPAWCWASSPFWAGTGTAMMLRADAALALSRATARSFSLAWLKGSRAAAAAAAALSLAQPKSF